jgi:YD repeat-containing protein
MAMLWRPASWAGEAQYTYDDLGRLVAVVDETGALAVYSYDAVGNLLTIDRFTVPGVVASASLGSCRAAGRSEELKS